MCWYLLLAHCATFLALEPQLSLIDILEYEHMPRTDNPSFRTIFERIL